MVFKICEGISCSSFFVKELDVIVQKHYFLIHMYHHINFLAILYPTSLANLVTEVGTWHSHQILLDPWEQISGYLNHDIEVSFMKHILKCHYQNNSHFV